MSSNLFSEISKDDPSEVEALSKAGDFLSTKAIGEKINLNVFRGLRSSWSGITEALSNFQDAGFLKPLSLATCANRECKEILDEDLFCEFCEEIFTLEEVEEELYYELVKNVPRSQDDFWRRRTGMTQELKTENGETSLGDKDNDFIYVEAMFSDSNEKVVLNNNLYLLSDPTFLPEYGNQPRAYAYKYTKIKMEIIMQNTNNFQNNSGHINIGSINQSNQQTTDADAVALLKEIKAIAALDTVSNEKLISLLDKSIIENSSESYVTTLNKLVGLAADYSAVLSPFLPQILLLLSCYPIGS